MSHSELQVNTPIYGNTILSKDVPLMRWEII